MSDQTNNPSSILDKVMESKEETERQAFNPQELISILLKKLTSKEADVLKRRFGLNDHQKQTLEAIGNHYNVTRERIRQIENSSIQKIISSKDFSSIVKGAEHVLSTILNQYGGICEQKFLMKEVFPTGFSDSNERAIIFIISQLLSDRFEKLTSSTKYRTSWKFKVTQLDFLDQVIEKITEILGKEEKPLDLNKVFNLFSNTDFYNNNQERIDDKILESFLEVSAKISSNPFSEYGLSHWGSVVPKRMNDKIYLILKKHGKPMHFVDIAGKITQIFNKKAYPPTVHNELILNKEYVLVGRGIYALVEWGYKKGVVADVIEDILQKSEEPLNRVQIVEKVLEQRLVKKNTIHLALTNKDKFKKSDSGKYSLVEK
ncbi:MAG: sigma factor-like helix-turn-helix DNA-binding protein [Patescibacteria group bacterium]